MIRTLIALVAAGAVASIIFAAAGNLIVNTGFLGSGGGDVSIPQDPDSPVRLSYFKDTENGQIVVGAVLITNIPEAVRDGNHTGEVAFFDADGNLLHFQGLPGNLGSGPATTLELTTPVDVADIANVQVAFNPAHPSMSIP